MTCVQKNYRHWVKYHACFHMGVPLFSRLWSVWINLDSNWSWFEVYCCYNYLHWTTDFKSLQWLTVTTSFLKCHLNCQMVFLSILAPCAYFSRSCTSAASQTKLLYKHLFLLRTKQGQVSGTHPPEAVIFCFLLKATRDWQISSLFPVDFFFYILIGI